MPDRSGQRLGNYRLVHLLGAGGFAEVYLGEHIYLEIVAAMKERDKRVWLRPSRPERKTSFLPMFEEQGYPEAER